MKPTDDLFQLIKSLDKNEKRYFRLFSSLQRGDKKYMLVFKAIEKQKVYDEKSIVNMFKGEKFSKRFPVTKQYLYNLLLSSLESYRHINMKSVLRSQLNRTAILYEKGLYKQCEKSVAKAKAIAVKYEAHLLLLELQTWEIKLMFTQSLTGTTEETIKKAFSKIFETSDQYKKVNEYYYFTSLLLFVGAKMGERGNHEEYTTIQKIISNPLFRREVQRMPFQSQSYFYIAHGVYFFIQNDFKQAYPYYRQLADMMETFPHQIAENQLLYISVMDNLSRCLLELRMYKEAAAIIEKLRNMQVRSTAIKNLVDFICDYMNTHLYIKTGAFNKGRQLLQSINDKWDSANQKMIDKRRILYFQYNAAYICFVTEDYGMANKYLNKILNNEIDTSSDLYCFSMIISLIVHFELGNQDLLKYRTKSVFLFLKKRKVLYKIEIIILDFIQRKLPKIHSEKALTKSFEILLERIKPLSLNLFEQKAFNYFDFISWLESKIENKPFVEVLRKKAIQKG